MRTIRQSTRCIAACLGTVGLLSGSMLVSTANAASTATSSEDPAAWKRICNDTEHTAGTPYAEGANCRYVDIDGIPRRFVVYVPKAVATSKDPAPAVFVFHGSGGSGELFLATSGWREVADDEGLIAVFPSGAEYRLIGKRRPSTKWHAYSLACDVTKRTPPLDDLAFVDEMLADLSAFEQVDEARRFVTGFSNGSGFAQRLSVERGDQFAAVASWAGGLNECRSSAGEVVEPIPVASSPIPTWLSVGSLDHSLDASVKPPVELVNLDTAINRLTTAYQLETNPSESLDFATWNGWTPSVPNWPTATWSVARWNTPAAENNAGNELIVSVLDGVTHDYPSAKRGRADNAKYAYVTIAEVFWIFFESHAERGA